MVALMARFLLGIAGMILLSSSLCFGIAVIWKRHPTWTSYVVASKTKAGCLKRPGAAGANIKLLKERSKAHCTLVPRYYDVMMMCAVQDTIRKTCNGFCVCAPCDWPSHTGTETCARPLLGQEATLKMKVCCRPVRDESVADGWRAAKPGPLWFAHTERVKHAQNFVAPGGVILIVHQWEAGGGQSGHHARRLLLFNLRRRASSQTSCLGDPHRGVHCYRTPLLQYW